MTKNCVEFELDVIPTSTQGKRQKRDLIKERVAQLISPIPFLFSHDVTVAITLFMDEAKHYETDRSPDIDNIIKPTLDAITGPSGLLIDDNQVSNVQCNCCDADEEFLEVSVNNRFEDVVYKEGLVFVRVDGQLYFPLNPSRWKGHVEGALDAVQRLMQVRRDMERAGVDRRQARYMNPIQRYFHRTRLHGFKLMEMDELRELSRNGGSL